MGEPFLSTENDGSPKKWEPSIIGRILDPYVFVSELPGRVPQRRA